MISNYCLCGNIYDLSLDYCPKCNRKKSSSKIGYCPICRTYNYIGENDITEPFYMCNYCRYTINECNKKNNIKCFDCITTTVRVSLDDFDNKKVTKRYKCHLGSRLMKLVKKHKINELQYSKLLRWKVI
jgi:hypothetical protein